MILAAGCAWASAAAAIAQGSAGTGKADKASGGKALSFDVVSIRPTKPGSTGGGSFTTDILPDGYRARGQSMYSTIMLAYSTQSWMLWSTDRFLGAPAWVMNEFFDIDAKVAPADVSQWQKQGNTPAQKEMLRAMLQTALAERCKLALHSVPAEASGYALTVAKRGLKFKEGAPDEILPLEGISFPDGGKVVFNSNRTQMSLFHVAMTWFVLQLSLTSSGPWGIPAIYDQTGLTGQYDFVLRKRDVGSDAANDSGPAGVWDLQELGLELKPAKAPAEALVIDHIERPSEN